MFDLRLVGRHELTFLGEQGQVEVVVVIGNEHLALAVDAHADRVVGDALAADLTKVLTLVVEDLRVGSALGVLECVGESAEVCVWGEMGSGQVRSG